MGHQNHKLCNYSSTQSIDPVLQFSFDNSSFNSLYLGMFSFLQCSQRSGYISSNISFFLPIFSACVLFFLVISCGYCCSSYMGATRPASPGNPLSARGGCLERVSFPAS